MAFDDFIKKAKESATQAQEQIQASRQSIGGAVEQVKSSEQVAQASQMAQKSMEVSREKVGQALEELRGLAPVLAQCGFILHDIRIGIPGGLGCEITKTGQSEQGLDYLEQWELSKVQKAIVLAIKKAYEFEGVVGRSGFSIGSIEMEIGIPPKVTVHLNPIESAPADELPDGGAAPAQA